MARRAPAHELLEAAQAQGFVTLARDAMRRVADGSSTLEEVSRVVDLTRDASPAAASAQSGRSVTLDPAAAGEVAALAEPGPARGRS